ncbi:hypothetical protein [Nonomuraea sp. NPDC049750]|uniref:hypothetical protein n=1 Tax=Nonomuraea sp. NPDC049750 TaxID=3154738 RepID=UPI0033DE06A6
MSARTLAAISLGLCLFFAVFAVVRAMTGGPWGSLAGGAIFCALYALLWRVVGVKERRDRRGGSS